MLIPSHAGVVSDAQFSATYKSHVGPWSSLRTYMADFSYNLTQASKSRQKHVLGAGFYNDKEGEFYNKYRILGRYAWHVPLSSEWRLSGAASLHVINHIFKSATAGSNGSDFAWAGSVGTSLYNTHTQLGIAVNDFNNPHIQPVDYRILLPRYMALHAQRKFDLSPKTVFISAAKGIVGHNSTATAHLGLVLDNLVGIHTFFHSSQGWGFAFDIPKLATSPQTWLDLSFAYRVSYSRGGRPPYNALEFNIAYFFSKEE